MEPLCKKTKKQAKFEFKINLFVCDVLCVAAAACQARTANRPQPLPVALVRNWLFSGRRGPSSAPEITWRDSTCPGKRSNNSGFISIQYCNRLLSTGVFPFMNGQSYGRKSNELLVK